MHRLEHLKPGDEQRVDEFLERYADSSMFMRSNLRRAGLVDRGERFEGTRVALSVDGCLAAVATVNWNGVLALQAPRYPAEIARQALASSPRPLRGIIGPWLQVVAAREALGLGSARCTTDSREDLFSLPLQDLLTPDGLACGRLTARVAEPSDLERLTKWGVDYDVELKGLRADEALIEENIASAKAFIAAGEQFVLEAGDVPVSTCTWNARLPDSVQIGGVFTPQALRGRGYARSVVAGALRLARDASIQRSILFTGVHNHAARRAYEAIGFRRVGDFGLVLFVGEHPAQVP